MHLPSITSLHGGLTRREKIWRRMRKVMKKKTRKHSMRRRPLAAVRVYSSRRVKGDWTRTRLPERKEIYTKIMNGRHY